MNKKKKTMKNKLSSDISQTSLTKDKEQGVEHDKPKQEQMLSGSPSGKIRTPEFYAKYSISPDSFQKTDNYKPDEGLAAAAHVALMVARPLLLTGEAGIGKTQFAFYLARKLGLQPPFVYETKSTSTGRDLFYTYDYLGSFHKAQILASVSLLREQIASTNKEYDPADYITFNALGQAILYTKEPNNAQLRKLKFAPQDQIFHCRSVVLLDEIDKAPREFVNDILNEIEKMYFRIPEINNEEIKLEDQKLRPIVVITSNSEKDLPYPFLRRCVYYHIELPEDPKERVQRVNQIIKGYQADLIGNVESILLKDAVNFFFKIRDLGITKPPSIGELLVWLSYLKASANESKRLRDHEQLIKESLGILVKLEEERKKVMEQLTRLLDELAERNQQ